MINYLLIFGLSLLGLISSLILTPIVGRYMVSIGKVGTDIFKKERPEIPESGGVAFMLIFLVLLIVSILVIPNVAVKNKLIVSFLILIIVTGIGLVDDFKGLSAKMKPLLLVLAALPVFFFRTINDIPVASPNPVLPFVGQAQLTIVYWGLAIFVIAIPSNASNMLDVMNGVMSGSGLLILATAFLSTFIIPLDGKIFTEDSIYYTRLVTMIMIGTLLGFWWFNRFPAKIFAGDTGSLGVGATIGLVAVYGQIEFILVVALLVHIMNSFSIISSVGGLRERREMRERPVRVEDGIIHASKHPSAPITMVRLLAARGPTTEKVVVKQLLLLVGYSCILALISAYLIRLEVLS